MLRKASSALPKPRTPKRNFLASLPKPQVSRALEKRTQLLSRDRLPKIWSYIDRRGTAEEDPEQAFKRQQLRSRIWGVICLAAGIFLLIPGLMEPRELLTVLILGILAICVGIGGLWRGRKRKNPFDRSAELFLAGKDQLPEGQAVFVLFSSEEMIIGAIDEKETVGREVVSYDTLTYAIETDDLFLLMYGERVAVLQKRDLARGELGDFREFLSTHVTVYPALSEE